MVYRLVKSFGHALRGLWIVWQQERNFKLHTAAALATLFLGSIVDLSRGEWAVLILIIGCVFSAETFNTALEELCYKFEPTHDSHIKKIKDLAAAAVLVISLSALVVGVLIFLPHLQ